MQHVQPSLHRQRRSDRASPKLVFAWEHFRRIAPELKRLWPQHYEEVAVNQDVVPLDPNWDFYYGADEAGILHILTARYNGHLAGYVFNLIGPHNHYWSTRFAITEMFWLHPRFRKGWEPVKLFVENIRGLELREAQISTVNFKLGFKSGRVGKLFARLGYVPTDIVMQKVL